MRTLPELKVGGVELRRFLRSPLTVAALVALALLPLLYAGLYLWSFWDPYGRLDRLPVALVVQDQGAKIDGKQTNAGRELADQLQKRGDFQWHRVDAAAADTGVAGGTYYMSLTIPRDFSARIAKPQDQNAELDPALLRVHLNDSNGYVTSVIADTAFAQVRDAASKTTAAQYLDRIFLGFNDIHAQTAKAARGAQQLAGGIDDAKDGSGRLVGGAATLTNGLQRIDTASGQLARGNARVAKQVAPLVRLIDTKSDRLVPRLRHDAPKIRRSALLVAGAADTIGRDAAKLPGRTHQAAKDASAAYTQLRDYVADHPELKKNPDVYRATQHILGIAKQVARTAGQVDAYARNHRADLRKLSSDAREVSRVAHRVADDAPRLAGMVVTARNKADALGSGLNQLASGSADLHRGTGTALNGMRTLGGGIGDLDNGLVRLSGGGHQLANGLASGQRRIPTYDKGQRANRSDVMSSPVRLSTATDNKVATYGAGFAPFFLPLALWVGAMIVYMLLRPLPGRALASNVPAWHVALAGWLPGVLMAVAQVLVLFGVLHFGLGLDPVHGWGLIGFLLLIGVTFMAMVQWLYGRFGPVGRVLALALLMLQLTSGGGTYPLPTSPAFFQAIAPFLPMSWVIHALRQLVGGGDMTPVWQACGVLAGFAAAALILSTVAARGKRIWTLARLHPALRL
ncbi:MAG TPA: YhgE/Pip domain-containing protein [Streptosporangiaceae bacterium]|jgi:putative membrane protein